MKVLLTGHRGYLGSHILKMLQTHYPEAEILGFDGYDEMRLEGLSNAYTHPTFFKGLTSLDYVIHAGAKASTTISWEDAMRWNYQFTLDLASCDQTREAHFIFFSSCAANPPCHTPYGLSKQGASEWLLENRKDACVFVPYNIYGKEVGRAYKFSNPENVVRRQVKYLTKPFVRDYVHVDDCLRMIHHAIESGTTGSHEMGTGIGTDFDELCKIGEIDTSELRIDRPGDPNYPIVGPADRVSELPYLPPEICVREWILRSLK